MKTPHESAIAPAAFNAYIAHARQQRQQYQQQMRQQQAGWAQAQRAADLLKQQFGVTEVFLFGSLLQLESVHPDSDIDLAVWGLTIDRYCEAVGTLLCKTQDFSVDLIRLETAQSSLLTHVLNQGVKI